jgi:hypothetical protein|nr:MAG TPA: hypothetical protein [Caudoviricetes sp.]DAT90020.1 MAG TPA: hypothetical protein [Caudoviricetes sp.]
MVFGRHFNRNHFNGNHPIYSKDMAEKKTTSVGLKKALFGEVNPEGGMPTEMKQLARTFKGTASFTTEADTVTNFYSEEEPTVPVETVSSETGLKQVKLNFIEWDNDVLVEVFGGSIAKAQEVTIEGKKYTVDKFKAPRDVVQIEKALRVLTRYNVVIDIPRAKILARFIWNLAADQIAQIEITATAMSSASEEDGAYEIYKLGEPTA